MRDIEAIRQIVALPANWHPLGGFDPKTAAAIVRHCEHRTIRQSVETGAGKSTLLFSHLSEHHTVFALDEGDSLSMPMASSLLRQGIVKVVEGPTQRTLAGHSFEKLQLALIDGPHAYPFPDMEYFYIYPHLDSGALLLIDDIDIPTINNMFRILRADPMYLLLEVVGKTAFFERTKVPALDPIVGWWKDQGYNTTKVTLDHSPSAYMSRAIRALQIATPGPVRRGLKRVRYGMTKRSTEAFVIRKT